MSKKFFSLKKIKKEYIIVIVLAIIAIYFVINSFQGITGTKKQPTVEKSAVEQYVQTVENKIKQSVSNVKGVGKVSVCVSVNGSYKNVYATEKTTTQTEKGQIVTETPVLVGGKPVLLREEYPEIVGVIIVAYGAENISVKTSIMNAVVTFLGIDSQKIIILNGKK